MTICVIGAGAMGSVYGGLLARAGEAVTLIDLREDHIAAIREHGLRIDGAQGEQVVRLPAFVQHAGLGPFDAAIIFTDTNSTKDAARTAQEIVSPEGFALTLQNGVGNVEALSEVLGGERVLAGVSMDSAAYRGPGHVSLTNVGPIYLGELGATHSARSEAMAAALNRAGFRANVVDRTMDYIWQKFTHNCCVNAIAALTGLRSGEIARTPEVNAFQDRIMDEVFAVASAKGVAFPDANFRAYIKAHCLTHFNKPSMLQHMEQGRKTEIDALNGAVVREAHARGLAVPYNEALVALVKGREKHQRQSLHEAPIDYARWEQEAAREAKSPAAARAASTHR